MSELRSLRCGRIEMSIIAHEICFPGKHFLQGMDSFSIYEDELNETFHVE